LLKHLKLSMFVVFVAFFAPGCTTANKTVEVGKASDTTTSPNVGSPGAMSDELAAARATYNATCMRCHKEDGSGGKVEFGEGETLKVPDLTSAHARKDPDEELAEQIAKGGDGMPAFGKRLTPEQINGLVRFIRRELQGAATETGTTAPAR
jgi:mono/diheme cytochrome c family protein